MGGARARAVVVVMALTVGALSSAVPAYAAFPGENGKIAFASSRGGDAEIYTINPDGTGLAQLTNNSDADLNPAWSPDGRKLLYERWQGTNQPHEIHVMDADGSGKQFLRNGDYPTWSPDGQKIAFILEGDYCDNPDPNVSGGIWVANADGTGAAKVACVDPFRGDHRHPRWSPDGLTFLVSVTETAPGQIWLVDDDGTDARDLTSADYGAEWWADWAPDGQRIVFTGDHSFTGAEPATSIRATRPAATSGS
jgi:Tol biopolymer transport system component